MDAATILKRRNSSPRNAKTWQDTPVRMGVAKIQHIGMAKGAWTLCHGQGSQLVQIRCTNAIYSVKHVNF